LFKRGVPLRAVSYQALLRLAKASAAVANGRNIEGLQAWILGKIAKVGK
jgi:hypothetical protein